jgi:hypothetical protein
MNKLLVGGKKFFKRVARPSILENRVLLYIFFVLAIINLVFLVSIRDMNTASVFIITGLVISFFNKNMVVILSLSLVLSTIFKYGINAMRIEGFDEDQKTEMEVKDEKKKKAKKTADTDDDNDSVADTTEGLEGETVDDAEKPATSKCTGDKTKKEKFFDLSFNP